MTRKIIAVSVLEGDNINLNLYALQIDLENWSHSHIESITNNLLCGMFCKNVQENKSNSIVIYLMYV